MCPSGKNCPPEGCLDGGNPCLPRYFICDGQLHCVGGEDEHSCGSTQDGDSLSPFGEWFHLEFTKIHISLEFIEMHQKKIKIHQNQKKDSKFIKIKKIVSQKKIQNLLK